MLGSHNNPGRAAREARAEAWRLTHPDEYQKSIDRMQRRVDRERERLQKNTRGFETVKALSQRPMENWQKLNKVTATLISKHLAEEGASQEAAQILAKMVLQHPLLRMGMDMSTLPGQVEWARGRSSVFKEGKFIPRWPKTREWEFPIESKILSVLGKSLTALKNKDFQEAASLASLVHRAVGTLDATQPFLADKIATLAHWIVGASVFGAKTGKIPPVLEGLGFLGDEDILSEGDAMVRRLIGWSLKALNEGRFDDADAYEKAARFVSDRLDATMGPGGAARSMSRRLLNVLGKKIERFNPLMQGLGLLGAGGKYWYRGQWVPEIPESELRRRAMEAAKAAAAAASIPDAPPMTIEEAARLLAKERAKKYDPEEYPVAVHDDPILSRRWPGSTFRGLNLPW